MEWNLIYKPKHQQKTKQTSLSVVSRPHGHTKNKSLITSDCPRVLWLQISEITAGGIKTILCGIEDKERHPGRG